MFHPEAANGIFSTANISRKNPASSANEPQSLIEQRTM
jgi:hypothetical protein